MKIELKEEREVNGDIYYAIFSDDTRLQGFYGGTIFDKDLTMRGKAKNDAYAKYEEIIEAGTAPKKSICTLESTEI